MISNNEARQKFESALKIAWENREALSSISKSKVIRIKEAYDAGVYPTGAEQTYIFGIETLRQINKIKCSEAKPQTSEKIKKQIEEKKESAIDIWIDIQGKRERILMTMAEMWRFLQIMKLYKETEWYAEMFSWLPSKRIKYFKHAQGTIEAVEKYHIKIIQRAILQAGGSIKEAAKILGVARTTLQMQLRRYKIDVKAIEDDDFNAPMCAHSLNELEQAIIDDEVELMSESTLENNLERARGIVTKLIAKKRQNETTKEKVEKYLTAC